MTLSIERARSRRPVTWLTILGVLLLPAVIGGMLVLALQNPTSRLDSMTAAVVNLDEPVTIDGQYTPLGRQLAAGLVEGSDEFESNITWVISNEDDAAEGLADGTYQAVITIPETFSADATSAGAALSDGNANAEQAQITVTTPPDGRVADDLITQQIAAVAASTMGEQISEATVGNVLIGFATIGDQIGEAADGADQLTDGAESAADGAAEIPDGARQLADGATALGSGTAQLAGGAQALSGGASELAGGLGTIGAKTRQAAGGAEQLGNGLISGANTLEADGLVPDELFAGAQGAAQATAGVATGVDELSTGIAQLTDLCALRTPGVDPIGDQVCAGLSATASGLPQLQQGASLAAQAAAGTSAGLTQFDQAAPAEIATQMRAAGSAANDLGSGLRQLASGVDQSAAGARDIGQGATDLGSGANALTSGATQLGDGATALADGATTLTEGLDALADGTGELADGLHTASSSLPSFSDEESTSLAAVIAKPVASESGSSTLFGPTAIPLLAAVVLWFGGLASFIALRAVPGGVLTSRRSSLGLALRGLWPAAAIGAAQGVLVALIVQVVAAYDQATWWGFAGIAALAGVAFAAVNQALVAVFGGAGRWVSALVGVLALAAGLISTVPGWLAGLGTAMPTSPALTGLISASGTAVAGLLVWGILSLMATTLAVTLRRSTSTRAVLAAA